MERGEVFASPRLVSLGAVAFLVALLLAFIGLGVVTWSPSSKDEISHLQAQGNLQVHVFIEGAVQFPGHYAFEKGACLGDLLDRAVPLQDADLKRFKRTSVLRQGKNVLVPSKQKISIYLAGDIPSPQWIGIPKGTRFCELVQYLPPGSSDNINTKFFNKRRYLKDGEVILIEYRTHSEG